MMPGDVVRAAPCADCRRLASRRPDAVASPPAPPSRAIPIRAPSRCWRASSSRSRQNQLGSGARSRPKRCSSAYPNFRLAHLIKGDLLLARTQAADSLRRRRRRAPRDKVADLRDEAIARLRRLPQQAAGQLRAALPAADAARPEVRHRRRHPEVAALPLPERQRHAALRRRLLHHPRQARRRQDRAKATRRRRSASITSPPACRARSSPTSTAAAPSRSATRTNGTSAWAATATASGCTARRRTPSRGRRKASDGCVVLANQDLDALAKNLQIGLTPVIISNSIEWLSLDDWQAERKSLLGDDRRMAPATGKAATSIATPATTRSKFQSDGQDFEQLDRSRSGRSMPARAGSRSAPTTSACSAIPARKNYVVVTFEQDYQSNNLSNRMKKRQYWIKEDGRWKIIYEGAGLNASSAFPLPGASP